MLVPEIIANEIGVVFERVREWGAEQNSLLCVASLPAREKALSQ
jgi:hypothetical protein